MARYIDGFAIGDLLKSKNAPANQYELLLDIGETPKNDWFAIASHFRIR